ncbi:AAA family ATPase [Arcobacter sp.]|uniref:AAA family ATPase n=1 Tax=Arcobacter sp. TaxID=1872629 RepID=UPI003D118EDA
MELVYLWVEDYKNIKKQGFNFSPRFDCKYDEDTKELTIEENKDYVSIFPKNINITAIVGENGSGKSNILRLLHRFFSEWIPNKIFIVFYHKEQLYLHSKENLLITENKNNFTKITFITNEKRHSLFTNIHEVYYQNENNHKLLSNKNNQEFNLTSDNSSHIIKHFLKVFVALNKKQFSNVMFNPEYIVIDIEYDKLSEDLDEYEISTRNKIKEMIANIKDTKFNQKETLKQILNILDLKSNMNNIGKEANLNNINNMDTMIFNMENDFHLKHRLSEKYKYKEELLYDLNSVNSPLSQHSDSNHFFRLRIDELEKDTINFIYDLPTVAFNIKIFDKNNVSFSSLSFGEKNLLSMLSMFISLSEQITYEEYGTEIIDVGDLEVDEVEMDITYAEKINQNFFLIDEYELGLHPQWHKEMLNNMISFFNTLNKNIHLIITTHSPFILSDLPKENVIFLEKGKQVYPFEDNQQTFGANIHTLLSHGFFMKDGLMGEFAKDKIDIAIKYLNQIKLSEDEIKYCENIILIIGEPIIKRELQKMLDSKRLSEVEQIKQEIKRLEERMTLIWKNSK